MLPPSCVSSSVKTRSAYLFSGIDGIISPSAQSDAAFLNYFHHLICGDQADYFPVKEHLPNLQECGESGGQTARTHAHSLLAFTRTRGPLTHEVMTFMAEGFMNFKMRACCLLTVHGEITGSNIGRLTDGGRAVLGTASAERSFPPSPPSRR